MLLKIPNYELIKEETEIGPDLWNNVFVAAADYRVKDVIIDGFPAYGHAIVSLGNGREPYDKSPAKYDKELNKQARHRVNQYLMQLMCDIMPEATKRSWF